MTAQPGAGLRLVGAVDRVVYRMTQAAAQVSAFVCALLIVATTLAVIVYQQGITIVWLDDVLRMLLIWLVYLGSVSLCFANDHIAMDAVYVRLPPKVRRAVDVAVGLMGAGLCAYVAKIGFDSMMRDIGYGMLLPSGYLPLWPQTLAIPLCFALMTVAYVSYLYSVLTNRRSRQAGHGQASEAADPPAGP
jgi:C4-dicarboxylate transporter DctQ subunit